MTKEEYLINKLAEARTETFMVMMLDTLDMLKLSEMKVEIATTDRLLDGLIRYSVAYKDSKVLCACIMEVYRRTEYINKFMDENVVEDYLASIGAVRPQEVWHFLLGGFFKALHNLKKGEKLKVEGCVFTKEDAKNVSFVDVFDLMIDSLEAFAETSNNTIEEINSEEWYNNELEKHLEDIREELEKY